MTMSSMRWSPWGTRCVGRDVQGSAHTIAIDPDSKQMTGVADYRRGGRPASVDSQTIALWDFAEPAAANLTQARSIGRPESRWSNSLPGVETDGRDHLRIHAPAAAMPVAAEVNLPTSSQAWSAEIKIDSARFTGDEKDEQLGFTFARSADPNQVIATMTFGRQGADGIVLHGHTEQGMIGPVTLSDTNELIRPVILQLILDPAHQGFQIASRDASVETFTIHGTTTREFGLERRSFPDGHTKRHVQRRRIRQCGSD